MKQCPTSLIVAKYKCLSSLVCFKTRQDTRNKVRISHLAVFELDKFFSVKGHCAPLPPLLHDEPIIDDNAKAEILNHYFNSVFTNE